jgi:serine/threonine protein kinase/tetratricopeptide (TPR) repeat protein
MPVGRRYALLDKLGEGGMGEVYRAYDILARHVVAFKRVRVAQETDKAATVDFVSESDGVRLALAREFRTLGSLRHPYIISVLDYGFDEERQPFFTMDYLENAQTLLEAGQEAPFGTKIRLVVQVLQAVAYLHRRGVIHRDLKPGNVLVVNGQVKVLDFGLSQAHDDSDSLKSLDDEGVAGTLAYLAPEILQGGSATQASDLFAIGVMAYELITGQHPFNVTNVGFLINDILNKHPDFKTIYEVESGGAASFLPASEEPTEPDVSPFLSTFRTTIIDRESEALPSASPFEMPSDDVPPDSIARVVARLMDKSPDARFASAEAVIEALTDAYPLPLMREAQAVRESYLRAARFVGREDELRQLAGALQAAEQGKGSTWLIAGESGVGKSRLIDEIRIRALVRGYQALWGQGVADGGLPYQLWREPMRRLALSTDLDDVDASILKDLVHDIDELQGRQIPDAAPLEGVAYQQRLAGSIANLFRKQRQPTLLLLEDLQWTRESLDILKGVCEIAEDAPLIILASYRDDEQPDLPERFPTARTLRLPRLNTQQVAALSESMLGEAGRKSHIVSFLERETEGNVYFLVEVVRALAEEAGSLDKVGSNMLPEQVVAGGIESFVRRRLSRLPPTHLGLLWLAAVSGRELDLAILERVKGKQNLEEWLATCSNCAVLTVQDGVWQFSHDKLRTGALAMIPAETRPGLHAQIATAIEQVYPDQPEQAATLAKHWASAGDALKERIYLQQAGEYALRVSTFGEAIRCFNRVLELLESTLQPGEEASAVRADVLLKLGEAEKYTGDYDAAAGHLREALSLRRAAGDQPFTAEALLELGDLAIYQSDYAAAKALCEEALTIYRGLGDQQGLSRALDRLGLNLFHQGEYGQAIPLYQEALGLIRALGDQKGIASIINNLGMAAFAQGDYRAATQYFEETLQITNQSGERRRAASALLNLGSAAGEMQDYESANRRFEQSLDIFRAIGERRGVALALDNLGVIAEYQADYARATRFYEESLAVARSIGNRLRVATTQVNLGNMARAQGKREHALMMYEEGLRNAREIEAVPTLLEAVAGTAALDTNIERAMKRLGLVLNHPATFEGTRKMAKTAVENMQGALPPERAEACLEAGKSLDLQVVVEEILTADE